MTIVFDQQTAANSEPNSEPNREPNREHQQALDPSTATGDALHWLAYQFISDELPDDAREAFGKRLMDCQEAREAVATAAELDGALRAVSHWPVESTEAVEPVRRQVVAWKRAATALALTAGQPDLRRDVARRLFTLRGVTPFYAAVAAFLMLASILAAQAVSVLFGYSTDQFRLAGHFSFTSGVLPVWFLLVAAPVIEELAWHAYGTDALRSRFSLFSTCMMFSAYWAIWHMPLASIKDYYHSHLVQGGLLYTANFLISVFPFVILMNWLYYKTHRNILIACVFHVTAGYFNEIFATHPDSKVIQTGLLVLLSAFVVLRERRFFFDRTIE